MKQYRFSLKDECMKDELDYSKSNYRKNKSNLKLIPVLKEILSEFVDGKIYNEYEIEFKSFDNRQFCFPKYRVEDTLLWEEDCRLYAENEMEKRHRIWDRKDHIMIGLFYMYYIENINKNFTITRNK